MSLAQIVAYALWRHQFLIKTLAFAVNYVLFFVIYTYIVTLLTVLMTIYNTSQKMKFFWEFLQ